jgi:hypothetical protein
MVAVTPPMISASVVSGESTRIVHFRMARMDSPNLPDTLVPRTTRS